MCQIADASVLHVQQNINDPMFTVIETYAVYHRRNEPIIRADIHYKYGTLLDPADSSYCWVSGPGLPLLLAYA